MTEKVDPRESVFPGWYDLSVKYEGYETKGNFGTIHVVNSHESQKPFCIKLLKSLEKPELEDEFVCESLDAAEEEDFELVKGKEVGISTLRWRVSLYELSSDSLTELDKT